MESASHPQSPSWSRPRFLEKIRSLPLPRPELAGLLLLAGVLYLWALSQNGWANEYYSAAVRSMAGNWHDFLYGSFDAGGLMTVDKPPLALWVQALSVKAFGYGSQAILVPQALMGMAGVGLLYDLTRRRWGRSAGFLAGLALALTPVAVGVFRHNNPDALVVLCGVAALWAFVRALERGATGWLVLAGACVGLGFEAKMGAALLVVPGMVAAWLWVAPRGRWTAVRQLLAAGAVMAAVGLAWAAMVELTPASSRPWVAGTTDNSVFSLILEYNGFGRLEGQAGGPQIGGGGTGGGGTFGGASGPLRLLNEALGGQAGWLLGTALVGGLGIAVLSRLRRRDPRTGWIVAVGGASAVTAVAFSFAGGIFHPYYVSMLAPFTAALVGATFAQVRDGGRRGRVLGALAIGAGAITSLAVISGSASELGWLVPVIAIGAAGAAIALLAEALTRWRAIALACGIGVLLIGPAIWSFETLGHPTSGTFPAGGPATNAATGGGPGGGPGGAPKGFGPGSETGLPSLQSGAGAEGRPIERGGGPGGGMFGGADLSGVVEYAESRGGGMIAVSSQSQAASSIIESGAELAGIGGFSGKETSVSAEWLSEAIESGRIRWILSGGGGPGGGFGGPGGGPGGAQAPGGGRGGPGGDTRQGSTAAIEAVTASECTEVPSTAYEGGEGQTLYYCGP